MLHRWSDDRGRYKVPVRWRMARCWDSCHWFKWANLPTHHRQLQPAIWISPTHPLFLHLSSTSAEKQEEIVSHWKKMIWQLRWHIQIGIIIRSSVLGPSNWEAGSEWCNHTGIKKKRLLWAQTICILFPWYVNWSKDTPFFARLLHTFHPRKSSCHASEELERQKQSEDTSLVLNQRYTTETRSLIIISLSIHC